MWVAAFISCTGPMAVDCRVGVKTDRLFADQDVCAEFVEYSEMTLEDLGAAVVGHCFRIKGDVL